MPGALYFGQAVFGQASATTGSASADLSGTLAGTGTATGALSASPRLSGTIAGVGTTTGSLTASSAAAITGTLAGAGSVTGGITAAPKLSGSISGAGTATGGLAAATRITGTLAGIGSATGTLAVATVNRSRHLGAPGSHAVITNTARSAVFTASGDRRAIITHGTLGLTILIPPATVSSSTAVARLGLLFLGDAQLGYSGVVVAGAAAVPGTPNQRATITNSGTRAAVITARLQAAVIVSGARRAVITQHQTRGS